MCSFIMPIRYELRGELGNVLIVHPMESDAPEELGGTYTCEVDNEYEITTASAKLITPVAPPPTTEGKCVLSRLSHAHWNYAQA